MLTIVPPDFRKRRGRTKPRRQPPAPPGEPLVLVAATYEVGTQMTLTFDRAIDVSGIVPAAFIVHDGPTGFSYQGVSLFDQPTPASVSIEVSGIAEYEGAAVLLDVASINGIAAADDGGTFAGVTDLELPFP